MNKSQIIKLLKLCITIIAGFTGLILLLLEIPNTESIGLLFILTKSVGFLLLYLFYIKFPFKILLEEHLHLQLTISLLSIILLFIIMSVLYFIHSYYNLVFNF